MPAYLSVSRRTSLSCLEVAEALAKVGIDSSAFPNYSSIDGAVEQGCRIRLDRSRDVLPAWESLRDQFGFQCAHLRTSTFKGCVLDFGG